MKSTITRLFSTISYLKFSQIVWQIIIRIKRPRFLLSENVPDTELQQINFSLDSRCEMSLYPEDTFVFLNLKKSFSDGIDWNFLDYGKLWNYNLEYFNFLHQPDVSYNF